MMTTSPKLQSYDPKVRQCFFEDEKKLRFFKLYTQSNCEIECLANFTLNTCGCVKFSMPHDDETNICGQDKLECYNDAEDQLLEAKLKQGLSLATGTTECNCKPSCTSIHYNAEISQTDFNVLEYIKAIGDPAANATNKFVMSKLKIFFKEPQFITSKRSELYGLSEFLANCGGILGEELRK
jgi:amiloride-sensitive sodium channel